MTFKTYTPMAICQRVFCEVDYYSYKTIKEISLMRVIGIDPGSLVTGYGVLEIELAKISYVTSGCIKTSGAFADRIKDIYQGLSEILVEYRPQEFAIEDVFISNNPNSALKLGQARGAAIAAGVVADLPVFEYAARRVKQAIVGSGRATKNQVQYMVRSLLNLSGTPSADAADALAVAICHINSSGTLTDRIQLELTN